MSKSKKGKGSVPPVENRWKKGVSGNPKGRPKKQDSLTTLMKEKLEKPCPADKENRTWGELIVQTTLQHAMKGNQAAIHEVWNRMDGKLRQSLEHSGAGNTPIELHVVYEGAGDDEPDEK
jgi:hypothetical protein